MSSGRNADSCCQLRIRLGVSADGNEGALNDALHDVRLIAHRAHRVRCVSHSYLRFPPSRRPSLPEVVKTPLLFATPLLRLTRAVSRAMPSWLNLARGDRLSRAVEYGRRSAKMQVDHSQPTWISRYPGVNGRLWVRRVDVERRSRYSTDQLVCTSGNVPGGMYVTGMR
jgi:hypothetical protein